MSTKWRPNTYDNAMCTAVVAACNCSETFLTSRVPLSREDMEIRDSIAGYRRRTIFISNSNIKYTYNLKFHNLPVLLHCSNFLKRGNKEMKSLPWHQITKHQKLYVTSMYLQSQHQWYLCSCQCKNRPTQLDRGIVNNTKKKDIHNVDLH